MQPGDEEYRKLLTAAIQKQIVILGPAITLSRVRSVAGISIKDDGEVISLKHPREELSKKLIDAFGEISGIAADRLKESLGMKTEVSDHKIEVKTAEPVRLDTANKGEANSEIHTSSPVNDDLVPLPAPLPPTSSAEKSPQLTAENLAQGNSEKENIKEQIKV